jgi:UDP-glucuronate decarboxylase
VNPIGPRACHDEGKRCAEALAVSYARQYEVKVRIARIFNTYGRACTRTTGASARMFRQDPLPNPP